MSMTPDEQRIAIAQACGWTKVRMWRYTDSDKMWHKGRDSQGRLRALPDYLNDLNAMHEAEKILNDVQQIHFSTQIMHIHNAKDGRGCSPFDYGHATAAQRAEAFLRTLNLWTK